MARLLEGLVALRQDNGRVIMLESQPGMGKSLLLSHFMKISNTIPYVRIFFEAVDPLDHHTILSLWTNVLEEMTELSHVEGTKARTQKFLQTVKGVSDARLPLLNHLLGINIPDNAVTKHIQAEEIREELERVIVILMRILCAMSKNSSNPRYWVFVIEDANLLDSSSMSVLVRVASQIKSILVIVSCTTDRRDEIDGPSSGSPSEVGR